MSTSIITATATNTGIVRTHNEDSLICMDLSIVWLTGQELPIERGTGK